MTTQKKNPVETALPEGRATQPVREIPEEAYFNVKPPDYTLAALLAQLPKSETSESNANDSSATAAQSAGAKGPMPPNRIRTEEPRIRVRKPDYTLKDLLAQITEENRHEEIDFGPPVGKEVW